MEKGFGRGSWYTDIVSLVEELPDEVWVSHKKHLGENWIVGQLKKIRAVILTCLKKMCLSCLILISIAPAIAQHDQNMKTQTSAAILVALAKFPSFIICERTLKFLPKRKAPLLLPLLPAFLFFWANTCYFAAPHYIRAIWEVAKMMITFILRGWHLLLWSILPSGPLKTKLIIINYNNHDKKPIYK